VRQRQKYPLPKANAQIISAEDAALRVIQFRQQLYKEISQINRDLDAAERLVAAAAGGAAQNQRPTQYNGRPLPRNWIDPKQADANFFRAQQNAELQRMRNELQQLNQQLRR